MKAIRTIGMVVFDAAERLDISGPLDVLGWARRFSKEPVEISLLSTGGNPIEDHLVNKKVFVDGSTRDFDGFDLFIVPGGDTNVFLKNSELIDEVGRLSKGSKVTQTVCAGAFLLAATGSGDGRSMTTHWYSLRDFASRYPKVDLVQDKRFVRDTGHDQDLWSSAGMSAGIDVTLNLVAAYWGDTVSKQTQGVMQDFPEPPWTEQEVKDVGPGL